MTTRNIIDKYVKILLFIRHVISIDRSQKNAFTPNELDFTKDFNIYFCRRLLILFPCKLENGS